MPSHSGSDIKPTIIAVMGATGVGKSSFINTVSKCDRLPVGQTLDSCTKDIDEVCLEWGETRTPVMLVDTPGFGDSSMSDSEVLRLIAKYLVTSHRTGTKLSGVVYMHRISDSKVEGGTRRNFRMFQNLCGSKNLRQVVIVTTWWDKVEETLALQREHQLKESGTLFRPMLKDGATLMRHNQGYSSAKAVLDHLLSERASISLKLQTQLVEEKRALPVTDAGEILNHDLIQNGRRCMDRLAEVQEEWKQAKNPAIRKLLEEERQDLQEERKIIRKQIRTLSKNLNERFVLWRILSAMGF